MAEKEYIEREAFKAEIRRLSTHYLNEWDTLGVLAAADRIPAADVQPVVRGNWIQDCDYHFRCSACGDRWTVSNGHPLDAANGWNFCPNCGADMRPEPPKKEE